MHFKINISSFLPNISAYKGTIIWIGMSFTFNHPIKARWKMTRSIKWYYDEVFFCCAQDGFHRHTNSSAWPRRQGLIVKITPAAVWLDHIATWIDHKPRWRNDHLIRVNTLLARFIAGPCHAKLLRYWSLIARERGKLQVHYMIECVSLPTVKWMQIKHQESAFVVAFLSVPPCNLPRCVAGQL